jgi:TolC family type I secretion outer membrane protein
MGRLHQTVIVGLAALALSACATSAPERVAPGTASAPNVPWTPPDVGRASARPDGLKPVLHEGVITLAEVIDIALANNPDTRAAWLEARAAEASVGSARSAYYPEVDVLASATQSRAATEGAAATTTIAPSLALTYLLFDFGGREAQVEQARQTLIAADFAHNTAIQDVVLRVQQQYYALLDAKALLAAQESTIKERRANLDAAEARHNAGIATIADVLQARTAFSQAELTRESIEGNLRTIEGTLATTMGLPATSRFDFGALPPDVPAQKLTDDVARMIDDAVKLRPELGAARAVAERARARVQEVRAEGMPTINAVGSAGQAFFNGGGRATPYSAGIALRFPLFTGWRNTYDVRRAETEVQIANEDLRGLEQQIGLQVWTSYYALQTATRRLATSRDLLASAQQSGNVAAERYRAGVGNIIDLLTAEAALENARAEEVQARADWFVAVAQLAHDTGNLTR